MTQYPVTVKFELKDPFDAYLLGLAAALLYDEGGESSDRIRDFLARLRVAVMEAK